MNAPRMPLARMPRVILTALAVAAGTLAYTAPAPAQVQRQPGAVSRAGAEAIQVADPVKAELEALRLDVNRLKAEVNSLRLTVKATQEQHAKHRHPIPSFGITTAKTISPSAPDDIQLAFTCGPCVKKGLTGPPE